MTRHLALLTTALLLPLSACSPDDTDTGTDTGAGSRSVEVVASGYPLQYVAERIAGDNATVTGLSQQGHHSELGIEETAQLAEADLVLYGEGLQPAVDEAVQSLAEGAVVEALEVLEEGEPAIPGSRPVRVLDGDPHFWLDPRALATVAAEVEARLTAIDPDHAADYQQNAAALHSDLVRLDGEMSTGLDDCERRTVVVSHDAFGYLGYRYDLDFAPIAGLSPEAEPSPAHLVELQRVVREEGITTVFHETLASPEMAEALAEELGLRTAVLDPVEGLSDETAHQDYLSLMRANLQALREANGCR